MPTPTNITDLSQTAASNFPSGSDAPSVLDDVQRAHASFIAQLRDSKGLTGIQPIAGAGTVDIGGVNSYGVEVTGAPTITSFGTNYNGLRFVRFTGSAILTHNATLLNLPGAANITTQSGDCLIAMPNIAGNGWNVVSFTRAAGMPAAVGGDIGAATATTAALGDNSTKVATTAFVLQNSNPIGSIGFFPFAAAPAGWLKANGFTIGNASSGSTLRANADTLALFTVLWNNVTNAVLPIQDSAGVASVRGADAAADFAANKRLPVPDMRGNVPRGFDDGAGVDSSRVLGSLQLDQMQGHVHAISLKNSGIGSITPPAAGDNSGGVLTMDTGNPKTDGVNGVPRTGSETRARNVALLACIKY